MSVHPEISVLMTVYNGERYLREAIESILCQDLTDFEFLIVDDGSTDSSRDIVRSYSDSRIILIDTKHAGLVSALNQGLSHAKGHYIARMDADDRALPERLRVQREFLDSHQECDLVCSDIAMINGDGRLTGYQRQANIGNERLLRGLTFEENVKPIIHPSVMMRKTVATTIGGYRAFNCAEDRDFWLRATRNFKFARIDRVLLEYRIHAGGISRTRGADQATASVMAVVNYHIYDVHGLDIFEDYPEIFKELSSITHEKLLMGVHGPAMAFRSARLDMLNGKPLRGWLGLTLALLRYGSRCLPRNSTKETLKIVKQITTRASLYFTDTK